jgi:hypothetical protein
MAMAISMKVHQIPYSLISLFEVGMDRQLPLYHRISENDPLILNLGAGYKHITGTARLSLEMGWSAPRLKSYKNESVDGIFALHFFEHLEKWDLLAMLRECERVMKQGASLNVVVPWYGSQMAFQDLDHKSFWTVDTWKELFNNPYYDTTIPQDWKLRENFSIIMGLNDRNLAVVSQLLKT